MASSQDKNSHSHGLFRKRSKAAEDGTMPRKQGSTIETEKPNKSFDKIREEDARKTINKLTCIGVFGNALLVAFKVVAGILGGSIAMISDAIHSLSDVLATAVAFVGSKVAQRPADDTHPYGHERFECLAALALSLILFLAGAGIGAAGLNALISGSWQDASPSIIALAGALISIVVKEAMFQYTMFHAKRIDSAAFKADAWHHRSDALSSIGAAIGIIAAMNGILWADAAASLIICVFIFKVAFDIAKDAVDNMMDTAWNEEAEDIEKVLAATTGVIRVDSLRTRKFGNRVYVEAEIAADGTTTLEAAHDIAQLAHDTVEYKFPQVKHIIIHVNPA